MDLTSGITDSVKAAASLNLQGEEKLYHERTRVLYRPDKFHQNRTHHSTSIYAVLSP